MTRPANSLFPEDIHASISSPFSILETQAIALSEQTDGVLIGEVDRVEAPDSTDVRLVFDVVAPVLDFRFTALQVEHNKNMPYPAIVHADSLRPSPLEQLRRPVPPSVLTGRREKRENEAASDTELRGLLKKVFESTDFKALAVSLIARSNEELAARQKRAGGEGNGMDGEDLADDKPPPSEGEAG